MSMLVQLASSLDSAAGRQRRDAVVRNARNLRYRQRRIDDGSLFLPFVVDDYRFTEFPRGARVIDVGCGFGRELRELQSQGCRAVGIDLNPKRAEVVHKLGCPVVVGNAERLPFPSQSADGIVCRLVLPYTNEAPAIAECARLLKPGGRMEACYHGAGFYLRYFLMGSSRALRIFGIRSILNSWFYVVTRGRSPKRYGDLYQSRRRLLRLYRVNGLSLECDTPAPRFLGFPVFIYHRLKKHAVPETDR